MKKLILLLTIILSAGTMLAQQVVQGTVTDAKTGETLIGVTVQIKGTTSGTITDIEGRYRLESDRLNASSVIVYSYIGYKSVEETLGSRALVNVRMQVEQTMLDEVVVIGYGTAKKRNVLGAVTRVDNTELTRMPVAGVDQALQGRAAGVQVTQNTGA
ncbi:carboxypeptidase-like regulatory domain-containing protein, partial [Lentimicrobium sp.]